MSFCGLLFFYCFLHWFPFASASNFTVLRAPEKVFLSHCRFVLSCVTIKLNSTKDVKAVVVCCGSGRTQNENVSSSHQPEGLLFFPLLSSPDPGKLI